MFITNFTRYVLFFKECEIYYEQVNRIVHELEELIM